MRTHPITLQKNKCGRKPIIQTPQQNALDRWLHPFPSYRRIPYRQISQQAPPELGLEGIGEKALATAFDLLGYSRRAAKKKGFSDDTVIWSERLQFAREAIHWTRERLCAQIFTDEVWAMGGAHTTSYVTVKKDRSDRYNAGKITHKYSKCPA